jgi:DNA repair exonuclease SbcCD ATPase subunit
MIQLKTLKWSNLFSYGENNVIDFSVNPITQLVGLNGHGKSSIALVLEEVLFNKNSKGIKKADVVNRFAKKKSYSINLTFNKDGDDYEINTTRSSTQTVSFKCNGEDISQHTATATFKLIEETLGISNTTFTQLVYQSSAASLEFLTATDTARKKFLIELLSLSRYTEVFESIKLEVKSLATEVALAEKSVAMASDWLKKNSLIDKTLKVEIEVPEPCKQLEQQLIDLRATQATIASTNKTITQNATYKKNLDAIDLSIITEKLPVPDTSVMSLSQEIGSWKKSQQDASAMLKKLGGLGSSCPTCLQEVSNEFISKLILEHTEYKVRADTAIHKLQLESAEISAMLVAIEKQEKTKESYEYYHRLYKDSVPTDLVDSDSLAKEIQEIDYTIKSSIKSIDLANAANRSVAEHNTKIKVVLEQLDTIQTELEEYSKVLQEVVAKQADMLVLQKAFSSSGLIAYKIENLVKDLEEIVNSYLAELSNGRFALTFRVENDKLNVVIFDGESEVTMNALSSGERARVNTATLLAIRKLMQDLSNTRINLLILDETISTLDAEGKESLINLLLREEHLNTILVSHDYTHMLMEKITVVKENNISRLEH